MAKLFYDRVWETSTVTGTNVVVLLGAVANYQTFGKYAVGDTVPYEIKMGAEWEIGMGTRTADGFARTTVKSSSNGDAIVNFSAGTKDVFVNVNADFLNGQTIGDLTAAPATIPDTYLFELHDPATGLGYKVTYAALKLAFGGTGGTVTDTSVPALASASVTNIGTTTATGNVTVGEANGTLYCLASTGSTATQAAVEASAFSQAITSTGAKSINMTGLTAGAAQYLHFMQKDAAGNKTPVLSASFTTSATAVAATGVTLTGPTGGTVSVASTNFTVGVTPVGGTITGTVVVTPSDNAGGGTFNPTSVSLTSAAPTGMFTYTPSATAGAHSITVTNNGSLTNPAAITYTSTAAAGAPLTVNTPAAQQAGVNFTLSGTYSGTAPAALDYSWDGGTTWYQPTASDIGVTTAGVWTLTMYVQNENAAQTVMVRNRSATSTTATTGAFAVTAGKVYLVTGYGDPPNSVKSTYDTTAAAGTTKKNIADGLTAAYWNVTSGGTVAASAKAGWGTSGTIPPGEITSAQNLSSGGALNGMQAAAKTAANVFPNGAALWAAVGATTRYYYWFKPADGPAVCVGSMLVTVTVA